MPRHLRGPARSKEALLGQSELCQLNGVLHYASQGRHVLEATPNTWSQRWSQQIQGKQQHIWEIYGESMGNLWDK